MTFHFALAFASKIVHFCVKNTHQVFNLTRILAAQVRFATCVVFTDKIKVQNEMSSAPRRPTKQIRV